MGCVENDAQVDDLAIVSEGARVGGREILLYDEIARAQPSARALRPARAGVLAAAAMRGEREEL
jgi:hypothetical protein